LLSVKLFTSLVFFFTFNRQNPIDMSAPKTILTLLITLSSLILTSQTFVLNGSSYIGKSKKEIIKLNEANNSKFILEQKDSRINSILYYDSLNTLTNHFFFARSGLFGLGPWKCFSYLVNVDNKSQFEEIKTDLKAKCEEKISAKRSLQVAGTKKYVWFYNCSEESNLYTFEVSKHHKRHNYQ